jgi:hypothetical protein
MVLSKMNKMMKENIPEEKRATESLFIRARRAKWIFTPESLFVHIWETLYLAALLYVAVLIPFQCTFTAIDTDKYVSDGDSLAALPYRPYTLFPYPHRPTLSVCLSLRLSLCLY